MYRNPVELTIAIVFAIIGLTIYIYLKASGTMWWGIQWGNVFRLLRRWVCILLCKVFNK